MGGMQTHSSAQVPPLTALHRLGQSIWLDFIRRNLLEGDGFAKMVARDHLMGVTSNPAIFEKAIAAGDEYKSELQSMAQLCASEPKAAYEKLAISDIQRACDLMAPTYASSARRDGYVSLEVSPKLAHDTAGTLEEARRLWSSVRRANLMIKVPATPAGVPAVRALISEGVNVNVTLLFAVEAYRQVAEAYTAGLETFAAAGGDPSKVASVASFFVSRVDSAIDPLLDAKAKDPALAANAAKLRGKIAIANAKLAYQAYGTLCGSPRWRALAGKGARPQRLLWASTGTKDPKYRDVLYVEELIGPDTVNTVPPQTLDAFREHGVARASLGENTALWLGYLSELESLGISLDRVCDTLLDEGVKLFDVAFDKLLAAVAAHGRTR
ncbi:MAG: transaldolase [Planctomycetes bacterium]|nr:transaldolase [Planctomycetota bacterium]